MSLNSKQDIWLEVCRAKYPEITETAADAMHLQAASSYLFNDNKDLVEMFEQYIMLKTLKGIK
jgi:hypothetical protein